MARGRSPIMLGLFLVLLGLTCVSAAWGTPEDAPPPTKPAVVDTPPPAPEPGVVSGGAASPKLTATTTTTTPRPPDGRLERFGLAAIALFLVNVWTGRRRNAALAAAVSDAVTPVLRRHFAHVGPGAPPARVEGEDGGNADASAPVLVREGADIFVIPASGRRGLGMSALTIRTRPRHDMIGLTLAVFFDPASGRDTLEVVAALPSGLHPAVLVAGRPAAVRTAGGAVADGGSPDVAALTGPVSTAHARAGGGRWPGTALVAAADQPAAWLEVVGVGPLGAVLGTDPVAAQSLILFKASTDGWGGAPRALSATVALPPNAGAGGSLQADLAPVARLVDAVLATADALAAYRPGPDAAAKASKVRAEAEARAARAARAAASADDAAAERRAARQAAEAERLARMAPDAREKALARKKRIEERRALAKRTKRI